MRYTLRTSSRSEITLDDEDLAKFKKNITESFVVLKQGVVNPSHVVEIIPIVEKPKEISELERVKGPDGKDVMKQVVKGYEFPKVVDLFNVKNMLLEAPE